MFKTSFDIHNYVENNTHMFAVMLKAVLALAHVLGFQGIIHRVSRMDVFCHCTLSYMIKC